MNRAMFLALLATTLSVFACNAHGATPKNITISVVPRVTVDNPYQATTFKVTVRIPRHKDNRLWSYSASCGQEIKSSERELDAQSPITYEWFEDLVVTEDCIFQVCLHRLELDDHVRDGTKKVKNYCEYQGVTTDSL